MNFKVTSIPFYSSGTVEENTCYFEVHYFLPSLILSLRNGADLGRSRLVHKMDNQKIPKALFQHQRLQKKFKKISKIFSKSLVLKKGFWDFLNIHFVAKYKKNEGPFGHIKKFRKKKSHKAEITCTKSQGPDSNRFPYA